MFADKVRRLLASRKFFVFVILLLVVQALWLVFSWHFPMLWDEEYHFGLIQFYAHHLSPFISNQPTSVDALGEITRYPAWGYHWLMSFPYRLISVFTHDQTIQVIILRLINVGLFVGALVAFRAALIRLTRSRALAHFVLFVLVLFPLSSLLAAQINYDNLQFLLTGVIFYWAISFIQAKKFDAKLLLLIVGVGLLACIVKYTFLPLFAALVVYLAFFIIRRDGKKSLAVAKKSFKSLGLASRLALVVLVLVGLGLFVERYGVNLVKYHAVDPNCDKVLTVTRCQNYSPYARNYTYQQMPKPAKLDGPLKFTYADWLPRLYRQYFSTGTRISYANYTIKDPLPIPYWGFLIVLAIAVICLLLAARKLIKRPEIQLLLLAIVLLVLALWYINYPGYLRNYQPVAVQGRYLLPVVPFGLALGALAAKTVIKSRQALALIASALVIVLVAGGGLITDLVRAEPDWYWHNQTVINVNESAQKALGFLQL